MAKKKNATERNKSSAVFLKEIRYSFGVRITHGLCGRTACLKTVSQQRILMRLCY